MLQLTLQHTHQHTRCNTRCNTLCCTLVRRWHSIVQTRTHRNAHYNTHSNAQCNTRPATHVATNTVTATYTETHIATNVLVARGQHGLHGAPVILSVRTADPLSGRRAGSWCGTAVKNHELFLGWEGGREVVGWRIVRTLTYAVTRTSTAAHIATRAKRVTTERNACWWWCPLAPPWKRYGWATRPLG